MGQRNIALKGTLRAARLGTRPLVAHCHLGLGKLHRRPRRGKRSAARAWANAAPSSGSRKTPSVPRLVCSPYRSRMLCSRISLACRSGWWRLAPRYLSRRACWCSASCLWASRLMGPGSEEQTAVATAVLEPAPDERERARSRGLCITRYHFLSELGI